MHLNPTADRIDGPAGVGTPATDLVFSRPGGQSGHFYGWDGMCITDQGDASADGTLVVDFQLAACGTAADQQWALP